MKASFKHENVFYRVRKGDPFLKLFLGYSAAVRSDNLLFVSGQVGARPDGSPEPDFEAQVRLAFANLKSTLLAGGCGFDDIVDVTTFHTDPETQLHTIMAVKDEIFKSGPYPNWTALGRQLACGLRFRDQGDRTHSVSCIIVGAPPQPSNNVGYDSAWVLAHQYRGTRPPRVPVRPDRSDEWP